MLSPLKNTIDPPELFFDEELMGEMSHDVPPNDWGAADEDILSKCREADNINKKVLST